FAFEAGTDRRRGDPHGEVEGEQPRVVERRDAIVEGAHAHEEREPGARDQVAVERQQMKPHSACSIASTRAWSTSRAISCGFSACDAMAPASTAAAAFSAPS